jgi:hypothetical protein
LSDDIEAWIDSRIQAGGVVKPFKPMGIASSNDTPNCLVCGTASGGMRMCNQCRRWTQSAQHISAAMALFRELP